MCGQGSKGKNPGITFLSTYLAAANLVAVG
jgi:hypothetical protein